VMWWASEVNLTCVSFLAFAAILSRFVSMIGFLLTLY
jgi:hypothetical protein